MPRDFDVFISYNREDRSDALELYRLLVDQFGMRVWFDDKNIDAGSSFISGIETGLSRSMNCLFLLGKHGIGKWQREELEAAMAIQVEQPNFRVIPILLRNANPQQKPSLLLSGRTWIDFREDTFQPLSSLITAIRGKASIPLYRLSGSPSHLEDDYGDEDTDVLPLGYTADVSKIVQLLIGESLYSRKDICVRELVQNAVDACQRQKARTIGFYAPKIEIRINSSEGWFEVSDNGEGMDPRLFKGSFSVIGKSIRDDTVTQQLLQQQRAYLIAKFGIGFVSVFIISNRVIISTSYEGATQINATITAFNQPFIYSDVSECGRDPNTVGTTIRVYLANEQKSLDLKSATVRYLRHVPFCSVQHNGTNVLIPEDWNRTGTVYDEDHKGMGGAYELRWGASPREGAFMACNWGFLISENIDPITPYFMPDWIIGEVNLLPGTVDLNVARDAIINNSKASKVKKDLQSKLRNFIFSFAVKVQKERTARAASDSEDSPRPPSLFSRVFGETTWPSSPQRQSTTWDADAMLKKVTHLTMAYSIILRGNPAETFGTSESPPLTLSEATELLLDLMHFKSDERTSSMLSLREIIALMHRNNLDEVYYRYSWYDGMRSDLATILTKKGMLVINWERIKVTFRGSHKGAYELSNVDVLRPILRDLQIKLRDLDDVSPSELPEFRVQLKDLPVKIQSALQDTNLSLTKVVLVNARGMNVVFEKNQTKYLNVGHPVFQQFAKWAVTASATEVSLFVCGLLQQNPRPKGSPTQELG